MVVGIVIALAALCLCLMMTGGRNRRSRSNPYEHTFTINGRDYKVDVREVNITDEYMADLDRRLAEVQAENREWEQQFAVLMGHQGKGMELEKQKDIENAMSEYEKAIAYGRQASRMAINNYQYSAERLMILYRKRKEYDSEIALIQDILMEDISEKDRSEFEYRLERVKLLKSKQQ